MEERERERERGSVMTFTISIICVHNSVDLYPYRVPRTYLSDWQGLYPLSR